MILRGNKLSAYYREEFEYNTILCLTKVNNSQYLQVKLFIITDI